MPVASDEVMTMEDITSCGDVALLFDTLITNEMETTSDVFGGKFVIPERSAFLMVCLDRYD